jgi:hypothetical protein
MDDDRQLGRRWPISRPSLVVNVGGHSMGLHLAEM